MVIALSLLRLLTVFLYHHRYGAINGLAVTA